MLFQCDLALSMEIFNYDYCSSLNSEDCRDQELPLIKNRAKGGTMTLWKKHLDQYITPCNFISSIFLPIVFSFPGFCTSILISIYLPTAGQDIQFLEELLKLGDCISDLTEKHPDAVLFIRGDANVNANDRNRCEAFSKFCEDYNLLKFEFDHPSYHHFTGAGKSDSQLDVLLRSPIDGAS